MAAGVAPSKYGPHLTAPAGTWLGLGDAIRAGDTLMYRVAPSTAFGFGKGTRFSQTRWRYTIKTCQAGRTGEFAWVASS